MEAPERAVAECLQYLQDLCVDGHQDPNTSICSFLGHSDQEGETRDDSQKQDRTEILISVNSHMVPDACSEPAHGHQPKNNSEELMKTQQLTFLVINLMTNNPRHVIWAQEHWWL